MNYLKILFLVIFPIISFGQVKGDWHALLEIGPTQIPLILHIDSLKSAITIDSPDQQAFGIQTDTVLLGKGQVYFVSNLINVKYSGHYDSIENKIIGDFSQNGYETKLTFQRTEIEKRKINRPQNPSEDVAYTVVEVKFKNKEAAITLYGTLTLPKGKGPFPGVVLASGSGQQDRNEEMVKHKPFLVLADYLTSNGIAVLRFDDRYYGESAAKFNASSMDDFASDVSSAVDFLAKNKKIDLSKLGVIGHSEGSIHAPIAASKNDKIKFIVSLAGVGIPGIELLIKQRKELTKMEGITLESSLVKDSLMMRAIYAELLTEEGLSLVKTKEIVSSFYDNLTPEELEEYGDSRKIVVQQLARFFALESMQSFVKYDPKPYFKTLNIPVLAVNGSKDIQVDSKQNLAGFERMCINPKSEVYEFEGLNHLFQKCSSCSISEYGVIETTIEPEVLEKVGKWILNLN